MAPKLTPIPRSITIITATRNNASVLPRALDSVRRQSYSPIEHIIVDGASTDDTSAIVAAYQRECRFDVVVIREPDHGMYEAINKGLRRARGEIIGILNSDDAYCAGATQSVVDGFATAPADVLLGRIRCVEAANHGGAGRSREWHPRVEELDQHMSVPHPGMFVRAEIYQRIGLFDESYKICADYEMVLRMRAGGVRMSTLDRVVCEFHPGGMSQTRLWRGAAENFRIHRKYAGVIPAALIYSRRAVEYSVLKWFFERRDRRRQTGLRGCRGRQ